MRDIAQTAEEGNLQARLAVEALGYRIKKYIGACMAALGGVEAIVFSAGIKENSPQMRKSVRDGLERLNGLAVAMDDEMEIAQKTVPLIRAPRVNYAGLVNE